jgi:hypothetical protein
VTNDEIERIINFIIESQERITEQQHETQIILAELARRDSDKEQRIARFERSYVAIGELLAKHDDQLVTVTDNVNKLTETVDRYITARGNNGSGGQ